MSNTDQRNTRLDLLVGNRYGACFHRAGLNTPEEVYQAVKRWGLHDYDDSFILVGTEAPYVRMCGRKKADRMKELLDSLGYDWRQYVVSPHYRRTWREPSNDTEARLRLEAKINELTKLLQKYLEQPPPAL